MYQEHSAFETPPNSCTIWRYMSFAKFVWLIAKETLFFSRLDQHDDWWEGLIPKNLDVEHKKYIRFNAYINCWHMNGSESDSMWKLYGNQAGETVAIKSTVGRLIESLGNPHIPVYIGRINYSERNTQEGNLYLPVTYKRKPFRHEKELRLCISSASNDNPPNLSKLKQEFSLLGVDRSDIEILKDVHSKRNPKGIPVSVDLNKLVHEIIICPNSRNSLKESIDYVVKGKVPNAKIKYSKYDPSHRTNKGKVE